MPAAPAPVEHGCHGGALTMTERMMAEPTGLATYLNDHLAGSVAALDLLTMIAEIAPDEASRAAVREVRGQIVGERDELLALLAQLGVARQRSRMVIAWVGAKLGRIKLRFDGEPTEDLRLFESLEMVGIGIEGKTSLWRALGEIAPAIPAVAVLDCARYAEQSRTQRETIERLRLLAAPAALAPAGMASPVR
jgi:hypothetical protein